MRKERYLYLVEHPQEVTETDLTLLKAIYLQYPYFQIASLLYSIATKKFNITWFQESLPVVSARLSNRAHWYNLLEYKVPEHKTPVVTQIETPQEPTQPKEAIDEVEREMGATLFQSIVIQKLTANTEPENTLTNTKNTTAQSFNDWLNRFTTDNNSSNGSNLNDPIESPQKKQSKTIIDAIIKQNPGPIRVKKERFYNAESSAKESLLEHEDLVSETLARIYESQGNILKAIRTYEILILKYPEKNSYFSEQINRLKQL